MRASTLACLTLFWSVTAGAADPAAQPSAERSPGDLTEEERVVMMQMAHAYNRCVYEAAMAGIDTDPDIRRIADQAMGACDQHLDELGETVTGWGFPAGFAEGFTRSVRDRAVHRLLPELAVRKGN